MMKIIIVLSLLPAPCSLLFGQRFQAHRDFAMVDSLNTGKPFKQIPYADTTHIKEGYTFLSKADGKFYQFNLRRYLIDSISLAPSDSVFELNVDSLCFIAPGPDTICVNIDSVYFTPTQVCYIFEADTTCYIYNSGIGNIYTTNGLQQDPLRVYEMLPTQQFMFRQQQFGGGAYAYPLVINPDGDDDLTWIVQNTVSQVASTLMLKNDGTGNIIQHFKSAGSGEDYAIGVDKVANSFTIAEGPDLGALSGTPFLRFYGQGDSIAFTRMAQSIYLRDYLKFSATSASASGTAFQLSSGPLQSSWIQFTNTSTGQLLLTDGLYVGIDNGGNATILQNENLPLLLYTNGLMRMFIEGGGDIGIGTSNPDKALEINLGTSNTFRLSYNDSNGTAVNTCDQSVGSTGEVLINASGSTPLVKFSDRVELAKGTNVTSANDLTLGFGGNLFHITGTTTINAITTANWQAGSEITLIFDSTPTVKNNTSGGAGTAVMKLAGGADFAATADDVLKLVYDGTSWFEISRSAN